MWDPLLIGQSGPTISQKFTSPGSSMPPSSVVMYVTHVIWINSMGRHTSHGHKRPEICCGCEGFGSHKETCKLWVHGERMSSSSNCSSITYHNNTNKSKPIAITLHFGESDSWFWHHYTTLHCKWYRIWGIKFSESRRDLC